MATTVTAAQTGTGTFNGIALTVTVLTGAAQAQSGAAASSATVTTPELAITPAATGSWVYGALANSAAAATYTPDAASTFSQNQVWSADTFGFGTFRSTATTTAATPVTLGATAPTATSGFLQIALYEILARSGTSLAEDSSSPAAVYTTTATTGTTASFSPPAGSLLVAAVSSNCSGTAGQSMTMTLSDSSGLTWTKVSGAQFSTAFDTATVWTARVPSGGSGSGGAVQLPLSVAIDANPSGFHWGDIALRFSGTAGVGASVSATAAQTIALTTTADNSAIAVIVLDWNGVDGSSRTWATVNGVTPSATNGYELAYFATSPAGTDYTGYVCYYPDAGAAGSKTVGITAPTAGTKPAVLAVEVLPVAAPSVVTAAAGNVTSSGATLNGTVNPAGAAATWQFEYGPDTGYGTAVPAAAGSAGSGSAPVAVSYILTGLPASATYHYRLNATTGSGTVNGADQTFTTASSGGFTGGGTTAQSGVAQLIVEAAFTAAPPVQGTGVFVLGTSMLGTGALGGADVWTEITAWVRSVSLTHPADRQQGPLYAFPPGTASIVLNNRDGRFDPDNLTGPYASSGVTSLTAMVPVRVRAAWNGVIYPLWQGYADSWDDNGVNYAGHYAESTLACTDGQKILNGITIPAVTTAVGAGETTSARITRILNAAGWYTSTLQRDLDPGTVTVQATTLGDTAWALMQAAADAEIGDLYIAPSGAVTFRNRTSVTTNPRRNTSQATFTDDGTGLPYQALTRTRDDTTIANDIQATRTGGALQEAQDKGSIAKYLFPRTYARSDLILAADTDALDWAQWILYVAAGDEDRFNQITITPRRSPAALWPLVLGAQPGDRITVTRNPPGLATPVTKDCFIRGMSHDVTPGGAWTVTWTLQDASRYGAFFVLGNATLGRLGSNALA